MNQQMNTSNSLGNERRGVFLKEQDTKSWEDGLKEFEKTEIAEENSKGTL